MKKEKMLKNMKFGNINILILLIILFSFNTTLVKAIDKIESVPLINLEELSPTFEEDKDELENLDEQNTNLNNTESILADDKIKKNDKVIINIKGLV